MRRPRFSKVSGHQEFLETLAANIFKANYPA